MDTTPASILLTLSSLVVIVLVAQVSGRTPPVLTGSDKSMEQYEAFRANVERDGPHDLIVLGNSIARQSIDPRQLQRALSDARGNAVKAYNFAAGGTPPMALDLLAELAYGVDDPEICIVVLTPRMAAAWTSDTPDRAQLMLASPYGLAIRDPVHWRGEARRWLLDHVAISGLRYGLRDSLLGTPPVPRRRGTYDEQLGFLTSEAHAAGPAVWRRIREQSRDWLVTEEKRRTLLEVVKRIRSLGPEVWLVQGATHPRRIAALPDPDRNLAEARRVIAQVAAETGSNALLIPDELSFSEDEFSDTTHLGARGAQRYTAWLASELGPALSKPH
jgi:hypothetical protein